MAEIETLEPGQPEYWQVALRFLFGSVVPERMIHGSFCVIVTSKIYA